MAKIKFIVGANYGDEGKGLMVDYFANQEMESRNSCIVVCHNGGSQRGHTVITPDGTRHVFHHFSSGVFSKADTFLSEDFIVNPAVFRKEFKELSRKTPITKCFADGKCIVTTPFDMLINQIVEKSRDEDRHGSCGLGIFETINRNKVINLTLKDLKDNFGILLDFLYKNRDFYMPTRLMELGVKSIPIELNPIIYSDYLLINYLDDILFMLNNIEISDASILKKYDSVLFESGQGLLLDQNRIGDMPNLTPSNTGIKNPIKILKSVSGIEIDEVESCYVSRSYLTRHGAGSFPSECKKEDINSSILDITNTPNEHQGSLRFGKLNIADMVDRINHDLRYAIGTELTASVAFTHLNEFEINIGKDFPFNVYMSTSQTRENFIKNTI